MAITDPLKINRKTFFNPSGWLGYDQLKAGLSGIKTLFISVFTIEKPTREETFEEAVKRQGLSEADIGEAAKTYYLYAWIFLLFGILIFVYGFYLLALTNFRAWILAVSCSTISWALAYRFHFYYFQIIQRKLGCTFAEWKQAMFN